MKVASREAPVAGARAREREEADGADTGFARFLKESSVRVVLEERSRSPGQDSQVAHLVALLNRPELRDLNTSPLIEVLKRVSEADVTVAAANIDKARLEAPTAAAPNPERVEHDDEHQRDTPEQRDQHERRDPLAPPELVAPLRVQSGDATAVAGAAPVLMGPVEARESVQQALAAIDDPASWASLDKNAALMVVDGLHIRLTTHDGTAAVTVEGTRKDDLIARTEELREVMGQSGIELQRLTAPGGNADAQLDRRGAAVVDTNDDGFDDAADGFFDIADINVTA